MRNMQNGRLRRSNRHRRGVALLMVIVFLVLLTSLAMALGYEAIGNIDLSRNYEAGAKAQMAAESGMDYLLYHLSGFVLTGNASTVNTPELLASQLPSGFNATLDGTDVTIPTISLDSDASFSAVMETVSDDVVKLTVTGTCNGATRSASIQMRLDPGKIGWPGVFPHGIMAKSPLKVSGSADLLSDDTIDVSGDVMVWIKEDPGEYPALEITGKSTIAGEAYAVGTFGDIVLGNSASIAGVSGGGDPDPRLDYVHAYCEEPTTFPTLDIDRINGLIALATTPYTDSSDDTVYLDNVYIPANTNPDINNKNIIIRGVLYIESPNNVKFNGQSTVQGLIISDPTAVEGSGTVTFNGSSTIDSPGSLPEDSKFDMVRDLSNVGMFLSGFNVDILGNTDISVEGPVFASGIDFKGSGELSVVGGIVVGGDDMVLSNLTGSVQVTIHKGDDADDIVGVEAEDGRKHTFSILYTTYEETGL